MTEVKTKDSQPASQNQGVQLGVGTLIIIALIVTTCSGRSEIEKVQKDTAELKQQLGTIEKKLDALSGALKGRFFNTLVIDQPTAELLAEG